MSRGLAIGAGIALGACLVLAGACYVVALLGISFADLYLSWIG